MAQQQKLVVKIGGETGCHGCGFTAVVEVEVRVGLDGLVYAEWPVLRRESSDNVCDTDVEVEMEVADVDDEGGRGE